MYLEDKPENVQDTLHVAYTSQFFQYFGSWETSPVYLLSSQITLYRPITEMSKIKMSISKHIYMGVQENGHSWPTVLMTEIFIHGSFGANLGLSSVWMGHWQVAKNVHFPTFVKGIGTVFHQINKELLLNSETLISHLFAQKAVQIVYKFNAVTSLTLLACRFSERIGMQTLLSHSQ